MALTRTPGRLIGSLHAFRAFAIVNIVLVHGFAALESVPGLRDRHTGLFDGIEVLFHDSTIYFALISGALFSAVLYGRGWNRFFKNKILHVLCPYAVMTLVFTAMQGRLLEVDPVASNMGQTLDWVIGADFFNRWLQNLLTGSALFVYWFIPVILVLFVATPLLVRLVNRRDSLRPLLLLMILLPLVFSRTGTEFTPSAVFYFAGPYTAGMWLGADLDAYLIALRPFRPMLAAVAMIATALLVFLFWSRVEWIDAVSIRESVFYVQKMSIAGLVLPAIRRYEAKARGVVDALARHAFAIYFLHFFFIKVLIDVILGPEATDGSWVLLVTGVGVTAIATGASWATSRGCQLLLGHRSRFVLGA